MHPTDELTARGGVMPADIAAAMPKSDGGQRIIDGLNDAIAWCRGDESAARLVALSASDAALARAIDAVDGSRHDSGAF